MWQNTNIRALVLSVIAATALAGSADPPFKASAQADLYAARWTRAAASYRAILDIDPEWAEGWDGLTRALIEGRQTGDAYRAADEAQRHAPNTAPVEAALGRVAFRRGELAAADHHFAAALKLNPHYPGALQGMASINALASRFATAQKLELAACEIEQGDPELLRICADALQGAEHIGALQRALAILDPSTREARDLRAHIAADQAIGNRPTRVLETPYAASDVKLLPLATNPFHTLGLRVRFNGRYTATLLLDTGAEGISLTARAARKAGLEQLEREGTETHGVGDGKPAHSLTALAREVRAGGIAWSNYPVQIFETAKTSEHDGIVGADVFAEFLIEIDPRALELRLIPYGARLPNPDEPRDAGEPPPGFNRVFRRGHLLMLPTRIDGSDDARLFVLDTGAALDLIDTDAARDADKLYGGNARLALTGVQGGVKQVQRANRMELTFAGLKEESPDMAAISLRSLSEEEGLEQSGILGMASLGSLKIELDYRDGAVRLDPAR